jgi:hypothetical protein
MALPPFWPSPEIRRRIVVGTSALPHRLFASLLSASTWSRLAH